MTLSAKSTAIELFYLYLYPSIYPVSILPVIVAMKNRAHLLSPPAPFRGPAHHEDFTGISFAGALAMQERAK